MQRCAENYERYQKKTPLCHLCSLFSVSVSFLFCINKTHDKPALFYAYFFLRLRRPEWRATLRLYLRFARSGPPTTAAARMRHVAEQVVSRVRPTYFVRTLLLFSDKYRLETSAVEFSRNKQRLSQWAEIRTTTEHSQNSNPCSIAVVSQMCINIGVIAISVTDEQPPNQHADNISHLRPSFTYFIGYRTSVDLSSIEKKNKWSYLVHVDDCLCLCTYAVVRLCP